MKPVTLSYFFSTENSGWYIEDAPQILLNNIRIDGIQGNKARGNHVPKFKCEPEDSGRRILFATRRVLKTMLLELTRAF